MERICQLEACPLPTVEEIRTKAPGQCPVWQLRELVDQAHRASCGLGVMCRDGIYQVYTILNHIVQGKGSSGDLPLLRELCQVMELCNECELSASVARLVLASLEAHPADWAEHVDTHSCKELVCMYTLYVAPDRCTGCGACAAACSQKAIQGGTGLIHVLNSRLCSRCGACVEACPAGSIRRAGHVLPRCPEQPVPVGSFATGGLRKRSRIPRG